MKRRLALIALCCLLGLSAAEAGTPRAKDFTPVCDTLRVRLRDRTGVDEELKMDRVKARGGKLDLYFSAELSYYPWHDEDINDFKADCLAIGIATVLTFFINLTMSGRSHK